MQAAAGVQAVSSQRLLLLLVTRPDWLSVHLSLLSAAVQGSFLEELAAAMCRAQGSFQALLVAAEELNQQLPSLAYVG
jgi:hypothetical protein